MEVRVCIRNLDWEENCALMEEAWFALPVCSDDLRETIGLDEDSGSYIITDFEFPIDINEQESVEGINYLYQQVKALEDSHIYSGLSDLLRSGYFGSIDELVREKGNIRFWHGCTELSDVAFEKVKAGHFGELDAFWYPFLRYNALANYLYTIGGSAYIASSKGYFEYVH